MGIFDRIMGTSTRIRVAVDPAETGPGLSVGVRLSIDEALDDKARRVVAGVTCTGRYRVIERVRGQVQGQAQGSSVTEREVWREVELHRQEQVVELRHGDQLATLTLPAHVPPSSEGVVSWEAWARVDRAKGVDEVASTPLTVRVPIESVPPAPSGEARSDGLTLIGVTPVVRQGDLVQGSLAVEVADTLKARGIKVRLHRRVFFVADAIDDHGGSFTTALLSDRTSQLTDDVQVAEVVLAGPGTFERGQRHDLAFEIRVPPAGPTTAHTYARVDWRLEAVIDRRLRGDLAVETPLVIV